MRIVRTRDLKIGSARRLEIEVAAAAQRGAAPRVCRWQVRVLHAHRTISSRRKGGGIGWALISIENAWIESELIMDNAKYHPSRK